MRVRRITTGGDWTFGRGKADYAVRSAAIRQNVLCRLRSLTNDWFADITHGIDWYSILGARNNEARIIREIEQATLQTAGVRTITRLEVATTGRDATINLKFTDLFDEEYETQVTLP